MRKLISYFQRKSLFSRVFDNFTYYFLNNVFFSNAIVWSQNIIFFILDLESFSMPTISKTSSIRIARQLLK